MAKGKKKRRAKETKTYDMSHSPLVTRGVYKPLRFNTGPSTTRRLRLVTRHILEQLTGKTFTIKKWRKRSAFRITKTDTKGRGTTSSAITFDSLCNALGGSRAYPRSQLGLPSLNTGWLDTSVALAPMFHAPCNQDNTHLTYDLDTSQVGPSFPITPKLDREGIAFSCIQTHVTQIILHLRNELVRQSDHLFDLDGGSWFALLQAYLNSCVSLVEITLHQTYYKAKYDGPQMGWTFDQKTLGPTEGQRFMDKFKWIGRITGRPLDNAKKEKDSVKKLKDVRNHLNHFDPPVLAYTIEDVADWLNGMDDVAMLLAKIRSKIGVGLSEQLVAMLLAREVQWVPFDPGKRRSVQPNSVGYASCLWPRSK